MDRVTAAALRIGLMAAALGSVIMLALMVSQLFLPVRWNWYNALAFFAATFLLAGARYIHTRLCVSLPAAAQ
ncbi:MAG TPA: hypothetical protein VIA98_02880 [Allosphingosinicella sp.]|jgi:hypothetical protein